MNYFIATRLTGHGIVVGRTEEECFPGEKVPENTQYLGGYDEPQTQLDQFRVLCVMMSSSSPGMEKLFQADNLSIHAVGQTVCFMLETLITFDQHPA